MRNPWARYPGSGGGVGAGCVSTCDRNQLRVRCPHTKVRERLTSLAPLEAFDIILRGGLGKDAAIGKPIVRRVQSPMVEDYVSRLFATYLERRDTNETFSHFCVRTPDADLISIASGNATGADAAA